jgi:hypothetical protein
VPVSEPEPLVYRQGELSVEEIREEVDRVWEELRSSEAVRREAAAAGVDVEQLDTGAARAPIDVAARGAGFGVIEILVVAAGVVARDLWKEVILPRIKERFGADAVREAADDDGDER